jgi:NAD-dependent deacetylase
MGETPERAQEATGTLEQAAAWIAEARSILVLTGAGISTDSGIPDYRGPQGTWTKNPAAERLATIEHYLSDPDVRRRAWRNRTGSPIWSAQPNIGHRVLVDLERRGQLNLLVTQNVDGLHLMAGTSPDRLVEIHGNARSATCFECGDTGPMAEVLARVEAGEEDPHCRLCGGVIKSTTILFGQPLVVADLIRAERAAGTADLLLAVGTKLSVSPVCDLVPIAQAGGARIVILNNEPTAYDFLADSVIRAQIADALPRLVGVLQDSGQDRP